MSPKPLSPSIVSAVIDGPPRPVGCNVEFTYVVEIDNSQEEFPATVELQYQAQDAPGNRLAVSGPETVSVDKQVGAHKWQSEPFTVVVDCTSAQTSSCQLTVLPFDENDATQFLPPVDFSCPCVQAQHSHASQAGSFPEIEITIRITGGQAKVTYGHG